MSQNTSGGWFPLFTPLTSDAIAKAIQEAKELEEARELEGIVNYEGPDLVKLLLGSSEQMGLKILSSGATVASSEDLYHCAVGLSVAYLVRDATAQDVARKGKLHFLPDFNRISIISHGYRGTVIIGVRDWKTAFYSDITFIANNGWRIPGEDTRINGLYIPADHQSYLQLEGRIFSTTDLRDALQHPKAWLQ